MENENDLKKPEANNPEPSKDPGAEIETVTPSTEELIPTAPVTKKEEQEDEIQSPDPKEEGSEEAGAEDDINNIETVAP